MPESGTSGSAGEPGEQSSGLSRLSEVNPPSVAVLADPGSAGVPPALIAMAAEDAATKAAIDAGGTPALPRLTQALSERHWVCPSPLMRDCRGAAPWLCSRSLPHIDGTMIQDKTHHAMMLDCHR